MIYTLTRALDGLPPGTWRACQSDGKRSANIACPKCGARGSLGWSHDIAGDGTVSPSVVCDTGGCDFHEFIRLDGWEP